MAVVEHPARRPDAPAWLRAVPTAWWAVGVALLVMPTIAGDFVLYQIFGWSFILGMIALSLMFLAGYGGMVSLAQMSTAGLAGYMVAVFGTSGVDAISLHWPWWLYVPVAILIAVLFATMVGMGTILLLVGAFLRRPVDRGLRAAAVVSLALVITQGLLGALTVRLDLPTSVNTLHLTFSMAFAASLVFVAVRSLGPAPSGAPTEPRRLAAAAVGLVFAQLVLGALVRHTGSAPACAASSRCSNVSS